MGESSEPKVVVSLTTISHRIQGLEKVLLTLLDQSRKADEILVYVSKEGYLLDEGVPEDAIPEGVRRLADRGEVRIVYTKNTGPYRKLLPALREYWDRKSTCILTADDDTLYPRDWVEKLLAGRDRHPGKVIAYRCRHMANKDGRLLPYVNWPYVVTVEGSDARRLFPMGKDGVLFSPAFFNERIFSEDFLRLCPFSDDIWFKYMALINGVDVAVIGLEDVTTGHPAACERQTVALWHTNVSRVARLNNDEQIRNVLGYLVENGLLKEGEFDRALPWLEIQLPRYRLYRGFRKLMNRLAGA